MPFLAAVSAFANASGVYLLIGVEEDGGRPTGLPGVEIRDIDAERLRFEQILANGLEPKLPRTELHQVNVAEGRYVIVVRVPRSWVAPHRVRKNDKFYGRHSAGRSPLDVGELRVAFTLSESVAERIRNFRAGRIAQGLRPRDPGRTAARRMHGPARAPRSARSQTRWIAVDMEAYFGGQGLLRTIGGFRFLSNLQSRRCCHGHEGAHVGAGFRGRLGTAAPVGGGRCCRAPYRIRQDGTKYLPIGYERSVLDALKNYLGRGPRTWD